MGRQSRKHRERRMKRKMGESWSADVKDTKHAGRMNRLREELDRLSGGEAIFKASPCGSADSLETSLEDMLAFESVESGVSLFEGLQSHGMDLPRPERLDEAQSRRKVREITNALAHLQVFLVGIDDMSGCELYAKLWNETLWEGCYVRKQLPGSVTLIDVSHKMRQSEMQQFLNELVAKGIVH